LLAGCNGCGANADKYEYPFFTDVIHHQFSDRNKDGRPDRVIVGYDLDKDAKVDIMVSYRITGTIYHGVEISGYKTARYPSVLSRLDENGKVYLLQFDDDENGTIDRYEDIDQTTAIQKR